MTNAPLVSVIIPTLNRAGLIGRALSSVRSSAYPNIETLVVDQESDDGTTSLVDSQGFRHITEHVRGAGRARKAGLAQTSGELVLFLDSDDWLTEHAIATLVEALSSPRVDFAYGGSQASHLDEFGNSHSSDNRIQFAPLTSASLTRRSAFERFGEFDDDNFSWPRWVIEAREAGLSSRCLSAVVCHRGIHSENVSKQTGATKELFALVRNHRSRQTRDQ